MKKADRLAVQFCFAIQKNILQQLSGLRVKHEGTKD
jgi:hypothetical protein